jgi:hydroxymethylpyrimidine pyrophosphatase-like HAD family hydrolase
MIKGVILDVDGVIVGEKIGFNSPYPNDLVYKALSQIRKAGIFVSLCTAKPYFSIYPIIEKAELDNFHICDGGAVLINPVSQQILEKTHNFS